MGGKKDEFSVDNILSEVQLNSKPSKTSEPKKEVDIDSLLNEIMLKKEPSRGNQKKSELKKENEAEFASLNYPLTDKKRFVLDKDFLAKHEDQAIKTNKENEKTILFDKAPQKKEFVMEGSRQQKENEKKPSVQAPPKKEETDDLHSPEDIPAILLDIKELKTSLLLRMGVLLLVGIVALGIVVLNVFRFVNISDMIDQSADPMLYCPKGMRSPH
ncbi:MAG: hypothetical protein K0R90_1344 [Oscillospiraceae bacterium]|nr:hypothetical protein [Oscillospiraceae bacterium]